MNLAFFLFLGFGQKIQINDGGAW